MQVLSNRACINQEQQQQRLVQLLQIQAKSSLHSGGRGTQLATAFSSPGIHRLKLKNSARPCCSCASRQSIVSSKAKNLGQDEFEATVLKSELPVLIDFWAAWCGPCKLVAPLIDWAAEEYSGKLEVYKVDTESNPQLRETYKPYGLPTLLLFRDGKIVPGSRVEGAISKAKLKDYLDALLQPASTEAT